MLWLRWDWQEDSCITYMLLWNKDKKLQQERRVKKCCATPAQWADIPEEEAQSSSSYGQHPEAAPKAQSSGPPGQALPVINVFSPKPTDPTTRASHETTTGSFEGGARQAAPHSGVHQEAAGAVERLRTQPPRVPIKSMAGPWLEWRLVQSICRWV